MLSGLEIARRVAMGDIEIDPYDPGRLNPNSYNVTLGKTLILYRATTLDMRAENEPYEVEIPDRGVVLSPRELYLACTVERIRASTDLVPMLDGRSSVGRLGLFVHATAGFGDVGWDGTFTLELSVVRPLRIYAGVQVAQVSFHPVTGEAQPYAGKYQGQRGPRPSGLWREFQ